MARLHFRGHHTGQFQGIPPTGKSVDIAVMDSFRVADGILAEHWALLDSLTMLRQIGAVDP